jgi:hypothetical protein
MNRDVIRQVTNLGSVIVALAVNILASALPLNGQNTGEISDRFQVYFVPAGYVFAIWGIIYVGWLAFAIYQLLPAQRENPRLRRLGYLFALSGLANAAWLFCWHYNQFGMSVLVMLTLLGLLIASYLRLDVGRATTTTLERWCVDIPMSIYLGWISVATIANITDLLYFWNWSGWGLSALSWMVTMLAVAVVVGAAMAITRHDVAYLLVFVWSFLGIAVKHAPVRVAQVSALAAAIACLGLAMWAYFERRRNRSSLT